jgi:hypothetical protein
MDDSQVLKYAPEDTNLRGLVVEHDVVGQSVLSKEIQEYEEDIDQVSGVAGRTSSLVFGPFAILLVLIFNTETAFPTSYGLRTSWFPYYILFASMIIPFQIGLEIIINHSYDTSFGTRVYDYIMMCKWRWRNRLTRWLLDDARLDVSFEETSQAVHHLSFSPQFFFIISMTVYAGLMITYGFTAWIQGGVPGFIDPAFLYYIILMFLVTRFSTALGRWLVYYAVWKPSERAHDRAFLQSITLGLKQKEIEQHQGAFRDDFFKKHREWLIDNLDKVYTPRGIDKYRSQLSEIYQKILNFNVPYLYKAPATRTIGSRIERPTDDTADDLGRRRFSAETDDTDLGSQAKAEQDRIRIRSSKIGFVLTMNWLLAARRRIAKSRGRMSVTSPSARALIKESIHAEPINPSSPRVDMSIPQVLTGTLNETSRAMLKDWLNIARNRRRSFVASST